MIRRLKVIEDTPIDLKHVSRRNIGLVQFRPWTTKPPEGAGSTMEPFFPKGIVIEVEDHTDSGMTEEI